MTPENNFLNMIKHYQAQDADIRNMTRYLTRASFDNLETVQHLYEHGVDIHYDKEYMLRKAVKNGCIEVTRYLCNKDADIHVRGDEALKSAVKNKHYEIVKILCENDANIRVCYDKISVLAVENHDLDFIKYLEKKGIDLPMGSIDNPAIICAIRIRNLDIVKYLCGRYTRMYDVYYDHCELMVAIETGCLDVVDYLYNNSPNTNDRNWNALLRAARCNNFEIIKYLCEHDADPCTGYYNHNETPIKIAAETGALQIVKYLHEQCIRIFTNNTDLKYYIGGALNYAIKHNRLDVIKYFCEHNAEINIDYGSYYGGSSSYTLTPLSDAIRWGHLDIVKYLCEHGADVNSFNRSAINMAINCAPVFQRLDIIRCLLHYGADVSHINVDILIPEIRDEINNYNDRIIKVKRAC